MRNGVCYRREPLVPLTNASVFSSWHTARANDAEKGGSRLEENLCNGLGGQAQNWPTPRSEDSESTGAHRGNPDTLNSATREWQTPAVDSFRSRGGDRVDEQGLDQQARDQTLWNTPCAAPEAPNSNCNQTDKPGSLGEQATQQEWPTPRAGAAVQGSDSGSAARQAKGANPGLKDLAEHQEWPTPRASENENRGTRTYMPEDPKRGAVLSEKAAEWSTPTSRDFRSDQSPMSNEEFYGKKGIPLARQTILERSLPDLEKLINGRSSSPPTLTLRRRLNPTFVEHLMGWPLLWTIAGPTGFGPAAMASWLCRQRQQLWNLLVGPT